MPKLKIKDWKGLYTNIDENDQNIELFRTSINFKHNRRFVEFEPRDLAEYELPEIDLILGAGWIWETGIYTTITNDPLDQDAVATKYNTLILVAKKDDSGTYHRLVYLKDLTNDSIWYELSRYGNAGPYINIENHNGAGGFTNSYFSTTLEGQAYFREEAGHVKLFLPHSAFWIGRMERALRTPYANYDFASDTGVPHWYIDKLIDTFDPLMTITDDDYPPLPHRLAWTGGVTTSTEDVDRSREIALGAMETIFPAVIEDGHSDRTAVYKWTPRFKDGGGPVPTTVVPFAPSLYSSLLESFYAYDASNGLAGDICFQEEFMTYYEPYDPASGAALDIDTYANHSTDTVITKFLPVPGIYTLSGRGSWVIQSSVFESLNWRYKGTDDTATDGFDDAEEKFHLIVTAVLDEREEIIVKALTQNVDEAAKWKIVVTGGMLLPRSNFRVTRLRYYIKLGSGTIYHLYKDIEFLDTSDTTSNGERANFDIIEGDNTAITLAQNIGIEPDEERWDSYKIIEGFRDIQTESGVSIGISNQDYSNVYYSVLGGGNLQPDLMYTQNILQVAGANVVNAVAVVNKDLAVLTDDTMYIIRVVDSVGALVFTIHQALEFGVKNQFDVAQMQGGVAINTRHGIYTTTGTQSNLLSEAIDNILLGNYETSRIYYNKDLHILYYKPSNGEDLYRFRFKDAVWEMINKSTLDPVGTPILTDANDILFDFDGNLGYLADDAFYISDSTDSSVVLGTLISNQSDLNEPSIDKLLNFLDVDYIGNITVYFSFDGNEYDTYAQVFPTSANRTTVWRHYPLIGRIPFQKISFRIVSLTKGTKIYGIELDFSVLKRRRTS